MKNPGILQYICTELMHHIESQTYLDKSRTDSRYFTRNRKPGFREMILFLLTNPGTSLQTALDCFFDKVEHNNITYSAQAFSKRRQYIRPEAIPDLVQFTAQSFYSKAHILSFAENIRGTPGTGCLFLLI